MGSFWSEAYESFRRVGGFVFTLLSFGLGVWAVYLPTPFSVDVRWLAAVAIVAYMVTAPAVDLAKRALAASRDASAEAQRALAEANAKPKIVTAAVIAGRYQFIIEPHRAFSHDSVVSIFNVEGDFEVPMGWGRVISIQDGGRLQVVVEEANGQDELWKRICKPEKALMTALVLKTAVPSTLLLQQPPGS